MLYLVPPWFLAWREVNISAPVHTSTMMFCQGLCHISEAKWPWTGYFQKNGLNSHPIEWGLLGGSGAGKACVSENMQSILHNEYTHCPTYISKPHSACIPDGFSDQPPQEKVGKESKKPLWLSESWQLRLSQTNWSRTAFAVCYTEACQEERTCLRLQLSAPAVYRLSLTYKAWLWF